MWQKTDQVQPEQAKARRSHLCGDMRPEWLETV